MHPFIAELAAQRLHDMHVAADQNRLIRAAQRPRRPGAPHTTTAFSRLRHRPCTV